MEHQQKNGRHGLGGWPGLGEGGQFAGDVAGLGRADPLEDLQGLLQEGLGLLVVAVGQGAAAQAAQRVRLDPGASKSAGQVQGLPVAPLGLREGTVGPVQRPPLVQRLGLAIAEAEVAEDAQGRTAAGKSAIGRRTVPRS
jgi:hypothetical protein